MKDNQTKSVKIEQEEVKETQKRSEQFSVDNFYNEDIDELVSLDSNSMNEEELTNNFFKKLTKMTHLENNSLS